MSGKERMNIPPVEKSARDAGNFEEAPRHTEGNKLIRGMEALLYLKSGRSHVPDPLQFADTASALQVLEKLADTLEKQPLKKTLKKIGIDMIERDEEERENTRTSIKEAAELLRTVISLSQESDANGKNRSKYESVIDTATTALFQLNADKEAGMHSIA